MPRVVNPTAGYSRERRAIRKLQGRDLGLLRQIPANLKKRFGPEAIASKGKEAVVTEMEASRVLQEGLDPAE